MSREYNLTDYSNDFPQSATIARLVGEETALSRGLEIERLLAEEHKAFQARVATEEPLKVFNLPSGLTMTAIGDDGSRDKPHNLTVGVREAFDEAMASSILKTDDALFGHDPGGKDGDIMVSQAAPGSIPFENGSLRRHTADDHCDFPASSPPLGVPAYTGEELKRMRGVRQEQIATMFEQHQEMFGQHQEVYEQGQKQLMRAQAVREAQTGDRSAHARQRLHVVVNILTDILKEQATPIVRNDEDPFYPVAMTRALGAAISQVQRALAHSIMNQRFAVNMQRGEDHAGEEAPQGQQ